jgi:transposase
MLDLNTRTAILRLHREGHGARRIARALGVSRNAVKKVIRSGRAEVPRMQGRETALDGELNRIRELHAECKGNQVRVHEKLADAGVVVAYSTLTAFCRRHRIGVKVREPVGRYEYAPGEEMQHDTSPHDVAVGGRMRRVQCASLVLGYSRRLFAQVYPRWTRLECRGFLTEGLRYHDGAAARCTIDNSSVIRLRGTGALMEPAPEMAAFGERFGFTFGAYELGDKDRNALAERSFDYIENNFYPGRTFESFADLNAQLRAWCDRVNARPRRLWGHVKRVPDELYLAERPTLRPLPLHVPEVYDLHSRLVDVEGYVSLHTNRYSVPARWLRRRVEVRETLCRIRVFVGHELIAEHDRIEAGAGRRVTLSEHRAQRRRKGPRPPSPEEKTLRAAAPELGELVSRLRARHGGQALRTVRRLHRFYVEYPSEHLVAAVRDALRFGLLDLARIERMTLRRIRGDFFRLPGPDDEEDDDG